MILLLAEFPSTEQMGEECKSGSHPQGGGVFYACDKQILLSTHCGGSGSCVMPAPVMNCRGKEVSGTTKVELPPDRSWLGGPLCPWGMTAAWVTISRAPGARGQRQRGGSARPALQNSGYCDPAAALSLDSPGWGPGRLSPVHR